MIEIGRAAFYALTIAVVPGFAGGDAEIADGFAVGHIADYEFASLMAQNRQENEDIFNRIAAEGRAQGIHAHLATQRPSVDVITGTMKNNFPCKCGLSMGSYNDSSTLMEVDENDINPHQKMSLEKLFALVLVVLTLGSLIRVFNLPLLYTGTIILGAAIAVLNVLLPSLIQVNNLQN